MLRERRAPVLSRVLDPDKQRLLIRREADPRDLAANRSDHEPTNLPGHRVGTQHLVVAHAGEVACITRIAIGENPQPPGLVEAQAIRAVEHVLWRDVRRTALRRASVDARVAGDHKQVPGKAFGAVIVTISAPAQNLPVDVFLARVRPAHRLAVLATLGVVGQRAIDLAILGADDDPFRTVHARGLHHAGREARVNQHFGLIGKTAAGVDPVFTVGQFDPFALAFRMIGVAVARIEARHVQGAVVQQVAVGLGVLVVDFVAADELVDELAAFVVAHVHHGVTVMGFSQRSVFMFEAAQRSSFDRRRLRIERVDFHDPAVTVELVRIFRQVEPLIVLMPVDLFAGRHCAITLLRGIELLLGIAAAEAIGEVLFAGQVRAPRRHAVGAVLEGAEDMLALRVGAGFHQCVAGSRAAEADRCVAVNATVVARALDERPLAVLALHFDHRHAFAGQSLAHLFGRLRHAAVRVEVAIVGVFVVDRHQRPVFFAGKFEQAHAVVVVTELDFLLLGGAVTARVKCRTVLLQWLAPTDQYRRLIARRQGDCVAGGGGDAVKTQQFAGACADTRGQYAAAQQVATEEHGRTAEGAGADETATAEADHFLEVGGLVFF